MTTTISTILIYGICETPSILWNAHKTDRHAASLNRQYIQLDTVSDNIRIGSKGWTELMPDDLLQFDKNQDIFRHAKEVVLTKIHPFNKPLRHLIISYFTWVDAQSVLIAKSEISDKSDPLFSNANQICFNAFLPLPHPKIPVCDISGTFLGAAAFDLGFHIAGKTYLINFADGQFLRKSERELRERLMEHSDNFITCNIAKPVATTRLENLFIDALLSAVPGLLGFNDSRRIPHGLYYPKGLDGLDTVNSK